MNHFRALIIDYLHQPISIQFLHVIILLVLTHFQLLLLDHQLEFLHPIHSSLFLNFLQSLVLIFHYQPINSIHYPYQLIIIFHLIDPLGCYFNPHPAISVHHHHCHIMASVVILDCHIVGPQGGIQT